MTPEEIIAMAKEAGLLPDNSHPTPETRAMRKRTNAVQHFAALVAAKEREALLGDGRCGEVPLPMQVAARWPSVPGSHKYAGAG